MIAPSSQKPRKKSTIGSQNTQDSTAVVSEVTTSSVVMSPVTNPMPSHAAT